MLCCVLRECFAALFALIDLVNMLIAAMPAEGMPENFQDLLWPLWQRLECL